VSQVLATGTHVYEYPRCLFVNRSTDILQLCGEALDRMGVAGRYTSPRPSRSRAERRWPGSTSSSDPSTSVAGMDEAQRVVAAYWAAAEARDWAAFGALVAEDVVYEMPQTRERVRGREAYLRFNAEGFGRDWHLTVQRITGADGHAASWIQMADEGECYPGLTFFELGADGLISQITDFWPEPYEPPAGRAQLTERF